MTMSWSCKPYLLEWTAGKTCSPISSVRNQESRGCTFATTPRAARWKGYRWREDFFGGAVRQQSASRRDRHNLLSMLNVARKPDGFAINGRIDWWWRSMQPAQMYWKCSRIQEHLGFIQHWQGHSRSKDWMGVKTP